MDTFFELRMAALVMLAKPFPPAFDKPIRFVFLIEKLVADSLCIPDYHVIVNLHSFSIEEYTRKAIWQPA
jgi:hypothetical protein